MKKILLIIATILFITSAVFPQGPVTKPIKNGSNRNGKGESMVLVSRLKELWNGKTYKVNDNELYTGRVSDYNKSTGKITLQGQYKNGLKNGKWTEWHSNGQKKEEYTYKDGENYLSNIWDKNGKIIIKDGNGLYFGWYESGRKAFVVTYKDGKEIEKRDRTYYENGLKWIERTYKDGENYLSNAWDRNGEIMVKDGNGIYTVRKKNGVQYQKGNYKDGKRDGQWNTYGMGGRRVTLIETYKDGEMISSKYPWQ